VPLECPCDVPHRLVQRGHHPAQVPALSGVQRAAGVVAGAVAARAAADVDLLKAPKGRKVRITRPVYFYILYTQSVRKYTGRRMDDVTARG
jgi:hypothetical protein